MILGQIGDDKPISNDLREVQRAAERSAGLVRGSSPLAGARSFSRADLNLNEGDAKG